MCAAVLVRDTAYRVWNGSFSVTPVQVVTDGSPMAVQAPPWLQ